MHSSTAAYRRRRNSQNLLKMRRWRAVMPRRRCWSGRRRDGSIFAVSRCQTVPPLLPHGSSARYPLLAWLDALAPNPSASTADLEARGHYRWRRFAKRRKAQKPPLQARARDIRRSGPDFSRLRQLLALRSTWYETTTPEILRRQRRSPQARLWIRRSGTGRGCRPSTRPRYILPHYRQSGPPGDRNDAGTCGSPVSVWRANPAARPSHCYAAERLVGKRFRR